MLIDSSSTCLRSICLFTLLICSIASSEGNNGEEQQLGSSGDGDSSQIGVEFVKEVCKNKKVRIGSISEMLKIASLAQIDEKLCPDRRRASLAEMAGILSLESEELCSEKAFNLIRSYHFRFIAPMKDANRRPTQFEPVPRDIVKEQLHPEPRTAAVLVDDYDIALMIPISVRHFFLSFALQLSAQCKRNLVANLKLDSERLLNDEDRELMHVFNKNTALGSLLVGDGSNLDFGNSLYLPDLEPRLDSAPEPGKKTFMKVDLKSSNSIVLDFVRACPIKFKPIYDKLLVPIIKLNKLGYEYNGDMLSAEERKELISPEIKSWLAVVHICEMFEGRIVLQPIEPVEVASTTTTTPAPIKGRLAKLLSHDSAASDSEDEEEGDDGDGDGDHEGEVKPISPEEAKKLNEVSKSVIEGIKPLEYEISKPFKMEDELWIKSVRQLDLELSRRPRNKNPFGFTGFMRRFGRKIKRTLQRIDPDKYAHYRRHSLWYSGFLNFMSSISNVVSITVTLFFTISSILG